MNRTQWAAIGIVALVRLGLYALTKDQIFGYKPQKETAASSGAVPASQAISIDTILLHARETLPPAQRTRIQFLENSISRGDVREQKTHLYHQLAAFWRDSARVWEPYAWYTAEAARLENSEKSLTFAARMFLENLRDEENTALMQWKALQAKDLFERSLNLNPNNDSLQVGLGAAILFGGTEAPMTGIRKLQDVVQRDSNNIYAQRTLGEASLLSGQTDKAIERYRIVVRLEPRDLQSMLILADLYERKGDSASALSWYKRSLPLAENTPGLSKELQQRIAQLGK